MAESTENEIKENEQNNSEQEESLLEKNGGEEQAVEEKLIDAKATEEEEFKRKYYYLAAEMDNQRKRFVRDRENLIKYGNEMILSSLIEVVDNFDHTMEALSQDKDEKINKIVVGIEMIRNQFLDVLAKSGLERIEAKGKQFDPNFHEAMAQQPVEGVKEGEVIMEYQRGYLLNGRLLRPSKVIVAKELEGQKSK